MSMNRQIFIPNPLWHRVQALAKYTTERQGYRCTASEIVRRAVVEYVERHEAVRDGDAS